MMEPRTFELAVATDGAVVPGRGVLAAFMPAAAGEQPVVVLANDPRHETGRKIDELAPVVLGHLSRSSVGPEVREAQLCCIDNYGRFHRVVAAWTDERPLIVLERFPGGVSVEAFYAQAGATGEAAIELLSSLIETPSQDATTPDEAEFLGAVEAHGSLPAPGAIFRKVEAAIEDGGAKEIAAAVQADPVIAASLVNAANAARFGGGVRTASVPQAVTRLGTGFVRRIVFVAEMMARYRKGACARFDYRAYWLNAIANGAAMCGLVEEFGIDARYRDEAFTTGLVAGIGWLAVAETYPALMARYVDAINDADPITKARAARAVFPCPIPRVSERYLERFAFPDNVRAAIGGRDEAHRPWIDCLARATRVANSISPFACNPLPTTVAVPPECQAEWERWRALAA